ncbi:unnamed protein product [Heligmosomoides polygyrus]|uniref:Hyaluronan/mRNA-binding protein domain-containing protein n=1 Tax=Heligmosomoides polygyrus TaxID=6339 RepID=A0A3P7Y8R0_HELPZ|nr:unnamed protein product [Heligmosomoides polygyrus]
MWRWVSAKKAKHSILPPVNEINNRKLMLFKNFSVLFIEESVLLLNIRYFPQPFFLGSNFEGERRGRGRGSFNGERRGRGFRGGRQFDRQSGSDRTGVRGVDKKDGHGRGNWGDDKDELAGETDPLPVMEEPEVPREKTAEELAQEALEAELAKQKTLKEYIDSQKEAPKFNVRKAGEGEEENFGKLVKLQKEVVVDKEEEEVSIIRREPREKALHIDIQFAEPNRGFRGDRGGDRCLGWNAGGLQGASKRGEQGCAEFSFRIPVFGHFELFRSVSCSDCSWIGRRKWNWALLNTSFLLNTICLSSRRSSSYNCERNTV